MIGATRDRIQARHWIETAYPLAEAAAVMAGEQSTSAFVRVPGETDELRNRYAVRVEESGFAQTASYSSGLATRPNAAGSLVRFHGTSGKNGQQPLYSYQNFSRPAYGFFGTAAVGSLRDPKEVAISHERGKGIRLSRMGQYQIGSASLQGRTSR